MKVQSLIVPRHVPVRHVTVNGTEYTFARDDAGAYVTEVTNSLDLGVFGRSRHFAVSGQSTLANPHQSTPPADDATEPAAGADETDTDADEVPVDAVTAEAQELLEGTTADIGRDVGQVSSLNVIRRALELEPQDQDRKGVHTLLEHALSAAEEAGVTLQ